MQQQLTPATGRSLYSIGMEYLRIADQLIDNGGELDEETETALQMNKEELTVKASSFALLSRELERKTESIDAEIERLTKLKKSYISSSDRVKAAIENAMKLHGIEKIEGDLVRLSFRKSKAVEIEDETKIGKQYTTSTITVSISKKLIGDAIKAGQKVEGAKLVERRSLQIK